MLAVVVLAVVWFVGGLLWASHTVQSQAEVAQTELQQFSDTLQAGDEVAAKKHLAAGEAALADASGAAGWQQVRIAGGLPLRAVTRSPTSTTCLRPPGS